MREPTEYQTERLFLRQWKAADREPFGLICADPEVMRFFISSVLDRATSDARIEKWAKLIEKDGWGFWALELKANGAFIGFAGLQIPAENHPYMPCVEIGWRLARAYWGHGYATEAAMGVLNVAFGKLHMQEIIATTALGNNRSSAVMRRVGMLGPEATFCFPDVPATNPLRHHVLYRVSREQWSRQNGV